MRAVVAPPPVREIATSPETMAFQLRMRDQYAEYQIPLEDLRRQLDERLGDRSLSEAFLKIRRESY